MKKSELDLSLLQNNLNTLIECFHDYQIENNEKFKEYIKDSCIKRFEYTYETSKKMMNKYLKKEYDKTEKDLSINNIFREMYALDLIQNFEKWVKYREKRNFTSHEYNENYSLEIIEIIPDFINDVKYLLEKLQGVLIDD